MRHAAAAMLALVLLLPGPAFAHALRTHSAGRGAADHVRAVRHGEAAKTARLRPAASCDAWIAPCASGTVGNGTSRPSPSALVATARRYLGASGRIVGLWRNWCGAFLRLVIPGDQGLKYNLARNWARYGRPATGPAPGVIVVWPHHTGIVTAVPAPGRIRVISGNDGHRVRERVRSTRGVIAFRWP